MSRSPIVADTGPLNYLVRIGCIAQLPRLFSEVLVPEGVQTELRHPRAPPLVRRWAEEPPPWLRIRAVPDVAGVPDELDRGEREAVALAIALRADLLMDDRAAIRVAAANGLRAMGTVGTLRSMAEKGLIDLEVAFAALRQTNFHIRPVLLDAVLEEQRSRTGRS